MRISELVQTLSYQRLTEIRGAEELFGSLARSAPAFGLIGTILGLVDMLRALKDFDKLGPGMALAVMSTFFGLVLSQVAYVPLAKIIERYGQDEKAQQTWREVLLYFPGDDPGSCRKKAQGNIVSVSQAPQ